MGKPAKPADPVYVEITSEVFYRAKQDRLDPCMWRLSPAAIRAFSHDMDMQMYFTPAHRNGAKYELYGLPVYEERERRREVPKLSSVSDKAEFSAPISTEEHLLVVCLECVEPYRGRTVYREWRNGEFI